MQWIFKNFITILLVACSAGQKNTATNSEGVKARTIDSNISSPMDEKPQMTSRGKIITI